MYSPFKNCSGSHEKLSNYTGEKMDLIIGKILEGAGFKGV